MALNKYLGFFNIYFEIDYMLEYIFLGIYLLLLIKNLYLLKIDDKYYINYNNNNIINNNSQNNELPVIRNYTNIQSAENCNIFKYYSRFNFINTMDNEYIIPNRNKGFSETTRQLFNLSKNNLLSNKNSTISTDINNYICSDIKFWKWFAGVLDGNGYFDIRQDSINSLEYFNGLKNNNLILKEIRIKLHERDVRILTRIQNNLHIGKIRKDKNKSYIYYSIYKNEDIIYVIKNLNGLIKLKLKDYKLVCDFLNIKCIEPNYILEKYDPYLSGLIDTDGSIIYNYIGNRIECNLELEYNEYSSKLNLEYVIPHYKPSKYLKIKKNKGSKSIIFKYQRVKGMIFIYDYFLKNRLYSDIKFYRVTKIKRFLEIRNYQKSESLIELQIYREFILDWIQYKNPLWFKIPFINKLNKDIVQN